MGLFEDSRFAKGTNEIARAVAGVTQSTAQRASWRGGQRQSAEQSELGDKVTFMSTGGGASLEFLEGKELPGVAALSDVQT